MDKRSDIKSQWTKEAILKVNGQTGNCQSVPWRLEEIRKKTV